MTEETLRAQTLAALRANILERLSAEGRIDELLPSLAIARFDSPKPARHCFYRPLFAIVLSGQKLSMIGGVTANYASGEGMLVGTDLPGVYQIAHASATEPFLGLSIALDRALISELLTEMRNVRPSAAAPVETSTREQSASTSTRVETQRADDSTKGNVDGSKHAPTVSVAKVDAPLLSAIARYVELANDPLRAAVLGPLILKEIHFRLLTGPWREVLVALCGDAAPNRRIIDAVHWVRDHYAESLDIEVLAARAAMAPSTLHRQFRALTSLSPLQFQKRLRLQEAERLMLIERMTVERAASTVGYESASQFSREYKRLFGQAPRRDIEKKTLNMTKAQRLAILDA